MRTTAARVPTLAAATLGRVGLGMMVLLLVGCPKREVRNDAGVEAGTRTAPGVGALDASSPLASVDAGLSTATGDAGPLPADDALPPTAPADLALRGKHLLEAIVQDNPELATDILFPREAFLAVRDVTDPAKVWEKKILGGFQRDIRTLSRRLKGKDAQFVALEVGQAITRVVPKKRDFKKPLWRVRHSKLLFTVDGRQQRIEVGEFVSWRGAWYVTKLR